MYRNRLSEEFAKPALPLPEILNCMQTPLFVQKSAKQVLLKNQYFTFIESLQYISLNL